MVMDALVIQLIAHHIQVPNHNVIYFMDMIMGQSKEQDAGTHPLHHQVLA